MARIEPTDDTLDDDTAELQAELAELGLILDEEQEPTFDLADDEAPVQASNFVTVADIEEAMHASEYTEPEPDEPEDDVKLMLRATGMSGDFVSEDHIASAARCLKSKFCTANLEEQIGPKATWEGAPRCMDTCINVYINMSMHCSLYRCI